MYGKIRRDSLDALFSEYIRTRAGWKCERCMRQFKPPTSALHCCHIFTRSKKSTRFDIDNLKSWCYGCHSYLDRNPLEKYDWYIKKFGRKSFDSLRLRSNISGRPDMKLLKLWVKKELIKLGNV